MRDLTQVGDLETFGRFVRLCAGRAAGRLNLSSLGNDCGISHDTARRWLSVLEASFVTFRLPPYHRSFNKRLTRRARLYFVDTGLLCRLLRIPGPGGTGCERPAHGSRYPSGNVASVGQPIQKEVWRLTWSCPFEPPGTVWIM